MLVDWEWSTARHRFDERFWLKRMSMGPSKEENEKLHRTQRVRERESENQQKTKLRKKNNTHHQQWGKIPLLFFVSHSLAIEKKKFTMFTIRPHSIPASLLKFDAVSRICVCTHDNNNNKKINKTLNRGRRTIRANATSQIEIEHTQKEEKSPPRCGKFNYREKQPFLKLRMSCKYFLVNIFLF